MITLRILTRKSKLGVGTYPNETVQKLLDMKMYRELRRIYYSYESISFQDDILDHIHLTHRIAKPGSDRSLIAVNDAEMDARLHGMARIKRDSHMGKLRRAEEAAMAQSRKFGNHLSKGRLAHINHGHEGDI